MPKQRKIPDVKPLVKEGEVMFNVLVVDDDDAVRAQLVETLAELTQLSTFEAGTLEEAKARLEERDYAIALVDIMLGPKIKDQLAGIELQCELGKRSDCVTLIVSGTQDATLKSLVPSIGGFDFVGKPINKMELITKVERALERYAEKGKTIVAGKLPPGLEYDGSNRRRMRWKKSLVHLTMTHLDIVEALISEPGKVVEKSKLQALLKTGGPDAVNTHISNIRAAFITVDPNFKAIHVKPGKGYFWSVD